jgi:hypothetical protein
MAEFEVFPDFLFPSDSVLMGSASPKRPLELKRMGGIALTIDEY